MSQFIERLQATLYKQRVVAANVIAFLGFVVIWFDPYAGIKIPLLLIGGILGCVGFALRIWAVSYQWPNISAPLPNAQTGLITSGPYAYMRHPVYLSMILLTCGVFLAFGSWIAALIVIVPTWILNLWQISYEEAFLIEQYGDKAKEYQRYLPSLFPQMWRPYPIRNGLFSLERGIKHDIGPLSAFLCFVGVMLIITMYQAPTLILTLIVLIGSVLFSFFLTWLVRQVYKHEFHL